MQALQHEAGTNIVANGALATLSGAPHTCGLSSLKSAVPRAAVPNPKLASLGMLCCGKPAELQRTACPPVFAWCRAEGGWGNALSGGAAA